MYTTYRKLPVIMNRLYANVLIETFVPKGMQ